MKLSMKERFQLLKLLPKEGNVTTLRMVHDLRLALAPSEKEQEAIGLKQTAGGYVSWDPRLEEAYEIGGLDRPKAQALVSDALEQLDKQDRLTEDLLDLWDRFVEGAEGGD